MATRFLLLVAAIAAPALGAPARAPRTAAPAAAPATAPAAAAPKPVTRAELLASTKTRFGEMDTNHDGVLDSAEVAAAQQREIDQATAAEQQRAAAEFAALDTNHDGQLSKAEFMGAIPAVKANQTPQQIVGAFDGNKDGKISLEEYQARPLASFNRVDTNHDGTISPQELEAARAAQH